MKLQITKKHLLLLLITLFPIGIGIGIGRAETISTLDSGIDTLERQLEVGRHEQLAAVKIVSRSVLAEFTTDGCSGGLSVGWQFLAGKVKSFQSVHGTQPPWESCCIAHDLEYHTGGVREITADESFTTRRKADLRLKICVQETGLNRATELSNEYDVSIREIEILYTAIADLMYRAVRIGGMPCTSLPWRWGYGWPECE